MASNTAAGRGSKRRSMIAPVVLAALAVLEVVGAGTLAVAGQRQDAGIGALPAGGGVAPRLGLRPAEEAKADLLGTVVAGNLDRTTARVAKILNEDPPVLWAATLGLLQIPATFVAALRTDAPIAVALVRGASFDEPAIAIAAAVRPSHAAALLQNAGKVTRRDGDAVEVELPATPPRRISPAPQAPAEGRSDRIELPGVSPRRLWLLSRDQVVLIAETRAALIAAGALALAARAPAAEGDVVITANPQALERARQPPRAPAAGAGIKQNIKSNTQGGVITDLIMSLLDLMGLAPFRDTPIEVLSARAKAVASTSLELRVDPAREIAARIRLHLEPDSAFARTVAVGSPYVADSAAMGGEAAAAAPSPTLVGAAGSLPMVAEARKLITAEAAGDSAAGRRWAALVDELAEKLTGAVAVRADSTPDGLACQLAFRLAAGVRPAEVMRLLATLAPAGQTGELLRELGAAPARPAPKVTRRNDRLHVRIALAPERAPGGGGGAAPHKVKAMAIDYLDLTFAVAAGRLLVASGPDAAARMDGMAREAIAPSRTGELRTLPLSERESRARELLAQALAQSRGAAAILYLDVVPFLKKMRLSTSHAAASLLALLLADELGSHTPVYVLVRGGEAVSFDVRMPIESLMRIRMIASIFDHTGAAPAEPAPAGGN